MSGLGQALFGMVFVIVGILSVQGVRMRWGWLIDPPDDLWPVYSQAMIKKLFGSAALERYTMWTGVMFLAVGAVFVVTGAWRALGN